MMRAMIDWHDERIQAGDEVIIYYTRLSGWPSERVVVIHTPAGAGDLWQFKRGDGSVFALNPYCPDFSHLVRLAGEEK